ncbi:hypothetical protein ColTof3_14836 [Colletotrichum tofieldiae]|nr:hypothetical protein ColTof3_14836 [Colletotrichum tofieldiae]
MQHNKFFMPLTGFNNVQDYFEEALHRHLRVVDVEPALGRAYQDYVEELQSRPSTVAAVSDLSDLPSPLPDFSHVDQSLLIKKARQHMPEFLRFDAVGGRQDVEGASDHVAAFGGSPRKPLDEKARLRCYSDTSSIIFYLQGFPPKRGDLRSQNP